MNGASPQHGCGGACAGIRPLLTSRPVAPCHHPQCWIQLTATPYCTPLVGQAAEESVKANMPAHAPSQPPVPVGGRRQTGSSKPKSEGWDIDPPCEAGTRAHLAAAGSRAQAAGLGGCVGDSAPAQWPVCDFEDLETGLCVDFDPKSSPCFPGHSQQPAVLVWSMQRQRQRQRQRRLDRGFDWGITGLLSLNTDLTGLGLGKAAGGRPSEPPTPHATPHPIHASTVARCMGVLEGRQPPHLPRPTRNPPRLPPSPQSPRPCPQSWPVLYLMLTGWASASESVASRSYPPSPSGPTPGSSSGSAWLSVTAVEVDLCLHPTPRLLIPQECLLNPVFASLFPTAARSAWCHDRLLPAAIPGEDGAVSPAVEAVFRLRPRAGSATLSTMGMLIQPSTSEPRILFPTPAPCLLPASRLPQQVLQQQSCP